MQEPRCISHMYSPLAYVAVLLLAVLHHASFVSAMSIAVHMQTDRLPTNTSGLIWRETLPELEALSICFRIFPLHTREYSPILSYAVSGSDNEILIDFTYFKGLLTFFCCGKRILHKTAGLNIGFTRWSSVCMTTDLRTKNFMLYLNGEQISNQLEDLAVLSDSGPLRIRAGGTLHVGQDQDRVNGSTNALQSWSGYVADYYVLDRVLSAQEALDYYGCRENLSEPLLSFHDLENDFLIGDNTQVVAMNWSVCQVRSLHYVVLPDPDTYAANNALCDMFSGELLLPEREIENDFVSDLYETLTKECISVGDTSVWLDLKYNSSSKEFFRFGQQKNLSFENWILPLQPAADITCAIAYIDPVRYPRGKPNWRIVACNNPICSICVFNSPPVINIRGLCKESSFDSEYRLFGSENSKLSFIGLSTSKVSWIWNGTSQGYWKLSQYQDPSAFGIMESGSDFPIGLHSWKLKGVCDQDKEQLLLFTSCRDGMFTCDDGFCIDISLRCNRELDCADQSDELGCNIVALPKGYSQKTSPPRPTFSQPLVISATLDIMAFTRLNIMEAEIGAEFKIHRYWIDSRLRFRNLKALNKQNNIEDAQETIWLPDLSFSGEDNSFSNNDVKRGLAWVQRDSKPLPGDPSKLIYDEIFLGSENHICLERDFATIFRCQFDLYSYPFDKQRCPLSFVLTLVAADLVAFRFTKVAYHGKRQLLEYEIIDINYSNVTVGGRSGQVVIVTFSNMYSYYITSAYVPTLLLVFIGWLTFYFSLEDFTNRIMVSLTSLLVMTSLFGQVSSGLPKTSYLKLIDVWFLFCIVQDFLVVVSLLLVDRIGKDVDRPFKTRTQTMVVGIPKGLCQWSTTTLEKAKINKIVRMTSLAVIITFTALYSTYVINILASK